MNIETGLWMLGLIVAVATISFMINRGKIDEDDDHYPPEW
jgi:hypothetical protein